MTGYIVLLVSYFYLNRFMLVVISFMPCYYLANKTQIKALTTFIKRSVTLDSFSHLKGQSFNLFLFLRAGM